MYTSMAVIPPQELCRLEYRKGVFWAPFCFFLFINDLPSAAQHSTVDIYADDTTLSLSSDVTNGLTAMSSALQQDLDDVSRWSAANKTVTNAAKTKCLLVTGKRIPCKLDNCSLELKLVNSDIEQVDSQKLLGVTIDKHLSFDVHVEELCKKLSQRIAVLRKIRRFIPIEQRILYYNAMIKQVMLYGSTIWSNCSANNLKRILKLQKRAARVILGADTRLNSVNLFSKLYDYNAFFCHSIILQFLIAAIFFVSDCKGLKLLQTA